MFTREKLLRDPRFLVGISILFIFAAAGLLAPWIAPFDPDRSLGRTTHSLLAPGPGHWLGTDLESRDVLSRLLHGARASFTMALSAVSISVLLGSCVGVAAGASRGWLDAVLMRIADVFLSVPSLVLLMAAGAFLGKSQTTLVLLFAATGWMKSARLVRAEVLAMRNREFVLAARGLGLSKGRILVRHVVPHAMAPAIVSAALALGTVLSAEASLSFLGFGIPEPAASWGKMVQAGSEYIQSGWWVSLFPAVAIAASVTAATLVGDALNDARAQL
jgi:peptide/nickel transport system permease protein